MKCRHCKMEASLTFYPDVRVCPSCFLKVFERRVKKTIRRYKMLGTPGVLGVALSGRCGSMVALHILHKIADNNPKVTLKAFTIDDGTSEARAYIKKAGKCAKELGVEHEMVAATGDVGECLYNVGVENKVAAMALGSSLEDELTGALESLFTGSIEDLPHLDAVSDFRGLRIVKPLHDSLEKDTITYADTLGLDYAKDREKYEGLTASVREMIEEYDSRYAGSRFQMMRSVDDLATIMKNQGND